MQYYSYNTPTGDVYGFFALAFIVSAFGLARKLPNFHESWLWELSVSGSYIVAIYVLPSLICFRAAFDNDTKTTEWTTWKRFYVAQGAIAGLLTFLLGIPLIIKLTRGPNKTIELWFIDDNLRDQWLNKKTGKKVPSLGLDSDQTDDYERAIISHRCYPILHPLIYAYFCLRYRFSEDIYVPVITITNCVILAVFYRPRYHFIEILFLVSFFFALMLFIWALNSIGGLFWAIMIAFHVWYSVQLCYCVADSNLLVDLQLGFFIIFLSTIYDLIASGRTRTYITRRWLRNQKFFWNHRNDDYHGAGGACPNNPGNPSKGCLWCRQLQV